MSDDPALFAPGGFFDQLEKQLARLLGRDRWPVVEAHTGSAHVPADLRSYDAFITFLPFSWTVRGKPYATTLRASVVRPKAMLAATHSTLLQYDPGKPSRMYYAPQQLLARGLCAGAVALGLSGAVAAIVIWSVR